MENLYDALFNSDTKILNEIIDYGLNYSHNEEIARTAYHILINHPDNNIFDTLTKNNMFYQISHEVINFCFQNNTQNYLLYPQHLYVICNLPRIVYHESFVNFLLLNMNICINHETISLIWKAVCHYPEWITIFFENEFVQNNKHNLNFYSNLEIFRNNVNGYYDVVEKLLQENIKPPKEYIQKVIKNN